MGISSGATVGGSTKVSVGEGVGDTGKLLGCGDGATDFWLLVDDPLPAASFPEESFADKSLNMEPFPGLSEDLLFLLAFKWRTGWIGDEALGSPSERSNDDPWSASNHAASHAITASSKSPRRTILILIRSGVFGRDPNWKA